MKQVKTTIILSACALVSLVAALAVYYMGPQATDSQNELIGEVFYPEFTDPAQASSMTLIVWNGNDKETREFEIKKVKQTLKVNGEDQEVELWAIPAHSDYPVESPERLRETAGSVMNIERLSLETISKEEHARLGVIDPKAEDAKLKEAGQIGDRIVLTDDSGNTVCDLIIGNAVDAEAENEVSNDEREIVQGERYFVRQPDQNEVYVARLNLQITTEFSEWIDDDLLQVGDATVNRIQFLNYDVKEKLIEKFGGEVPVRQNFEEMIVNKENGSWVYGDLKTDTEELDSGPLSTLESQIQNLSILEVQPKPTYQDSDMKILNADLTVNAPDGMSRNDQIRIQQQVLGPQGFIIGLKDENKVVPSLLSTNGELKFATDDGLVYNMVFGYDVKMDGEEFEFASADKTDEAKADDGSTDSDDEGDSKKGKIMSVHVTFDKSLIEKPLPPVKPVAPEKPDLGLPVPANPGPANPGSDGKGPGKEDPAKQGSPKSDDKGESKKDAPLSKPAGDLNADKSKSEPKKEVEVEAKKADEAGGCGDEWLTSADQEKAEPEKTEQEKAKQQKEDPAKKEAAPKQDTSKEETPKKDSETKTEKQEPKKEEPAKSDAKKEPKKEDPKQDGAQQDGGPQKDTKQDVPPVKTPEEIFTEKMQAYDAAVQQHQLAMQQYETQLQEYEEAMKEYEKKVADNQKKVADLNARFADWFYIVDAADLEKVKLSRADIVKPKEEKEDGNSGAPVPNIPGLNGIPGFNPKSVPEVSPKKEEPKKEDPVNEQPEQKEPVEKEGPEKKGPEKTDSTTDSPATKSPAKEDPKSKAAEPKKEEAKSESKAEKDPVEKTKADAKGN